MKHHGFVYLATAALLSTAVGCVDGSPPPKDVNATEGGTITLASCGYDVTTRVGASAPIEGSNVVGSDPTPKHVHLGFQGDPSTSVVVQWRTNDDETLASTVEWGEGSSTDNTLEGLTFIYISGFNQSGETIRMHEAHLCGLQPDTEYSYRVGGGGTWSETYKFRTAPSPSDSAAEITVAVLGDSRDGFDVWEKFVDLADTYAPDLVLFSGDAVTVGAVQLEWETFFSVGEPLLATTPIIGAHGNHDVNAINYYSQFALPGNEEDFGFDYGPMHVTVLNDTPFDAGDLSGAAPQFLEADLAASEDAPWSVVMHHRPIWSASTRHGSDQFLQENWQPIIDDHEVDLVVAGHDHDYERSKPMRGNTPQGSPADGTVYLVSGGAGAGLYGNGSDFWTEVSEKTHSMIILTIRTGMLEMVAIREDGTMIDSMTITK